MYATYRNEKYPGKLSNPRIKPSHHLKYHLQLTIKDVKGKTGDQLWEVTRKGAVKKVYYYADLSVPSPLIKVASDLVFFLVQRGRHTTNGDFPYKGLLLYSFSKLCLPFLKNTQLKMIFMPVRHILGLYILAPCNSIH